MKLDLNDYALGSKVATELVNSSPSVRRIGGEALGDVADLRSFLRTHIDSGGDAIRHRSLSEVDLREVLELRARVRAVLDSSGSTLVAEANGLVSSHPTALALTRGDGDEWQWSITTPREASIADELEVLAGSGILATVRALGHERIRPCAATDCDGVFIDTSRAGRRRYCSPGLCGNRANVARFRARQRDGSADS